MGQLDPLAAVAQLAQVVRVAPSRAHAVIRAPTQVWNAQGDRQRNAQSVTVRVRRVVPMVIADPPATLMIHDQPLVVVVVGRRVRASELVATPVWHPGASRNR